MPRPRRKANRRVREAFPAATILRPSIVFGPEDDFFNRFAAMARMAPALPLVGGGKTRFQPVFVGDVAAAIATALHSDAARGKTYELGGPTTYSFQQLLELDADGNRAQAAAGAPALRPGLLHGLLPATGAQAATDAGSGQAAASATMWCRPRPLTLADLGITPTSVEVEVPAYLWRYRAKGQYAAALPGESACAQKSRQNGKRQCQRE